MRLLVSTNSIISETTKPIEANSHNQILLSGSVGAPIGDCFWWGAASAKKFFSGTKTFYNIYNIFAAARFPGFVNMFRAKSNKSEFDIR